MTSHGFSFPPPPPPPPSFSGPPQQHPPSVIGHGHNSTGPRGGRGVGGYHRGRGRGDGHRSRRGGHLASQDVGPSSLYRQNNSASVTSYTSFASPPPAPNAPPYQGSPFPPQQAHSTFPTGRPFAGPPTPRISSYSHRPSYDAAYGPSTKGSRPPQLPPPARYTSAVRPPPHSYPTISHAAHTPAAVVTPPVHWGFEDPSSRGFYSGASRASKPVAFARPGAPYNNAHGNLGLGGGGFTNHGNKRTFSSAFEKPQPIAPRSTAPPPVPSFGNPLPAKPPPPADAARKPRKKKCRHNQLGLTPRGEEHESSEEEDDVDEEAKLADGLGAGPLQFTYKGRTSTLQSPAEIAAWVEERKKRYPTQARIEEKKRVLEEAKKARNQSMKQKELQLEENRRQQKEARAQKEREKLDRKGQQKHTSDAMDAAAKAKLKAEKLRRKLVKEEKRVAKAEANAERARLKAEALRQGFHESNAVSRPEFGPDTLQAVAVATSSDDGGHLDEHGEKSNLLLTSGHSALEEPREASDRVLSHETATPQADAGELDAALWTPLSEPTDSSDETSSSGSDASSLLSSSSLSDTGDSDGDSPPEEASSHRDGPQRVAPPPREGKKPKKLCHHFARKGRCSRGDRCRFLHELPDGGARARPVEMKGHEKATKKGLLQMASLFVLAQPIDPTDQELMLTSVPSGRRSGEGRRGPPRNASNYLARFTRGVE